MQGYFSNNVLQRPTIFQFNSHPFFIIHQIMVGKSFACTDLKHFRRSFSFDHDLSELKTLPQQRELVNSLSENQNNLESRSDAAVCLRFSRKHR